MAAGRNQKNNADYFPHDADASSDEKLIYLESKFGLTGYAIYFKFLECMTRAEEFKLPWSEIKKAVYASKFGVSVTEIDQIVTECCREEIKAFVVEDGYLYSPGLLKRFEPLLQKREYNRQKYEEKKQEDIIQQQKKEFQKQKSDSKGKESKEEKSIYTEPFLKFWEAYPKKTGKGDAFKAWRNIKNPKPSTDEIIQTVQKYNQTEQWQTKKFIPNPATFINRRQWEDEIGEPENQKPHFDPEEEKKKLEDACS